MITRWQGNVIIVILLVGIGAPVWSFLKPPQQWEYKVVEVIAEVSSSARSLGENYEKLSYKTIPSVEIQRALESHGREGWELVSVALELETAHPNFGDSGYVTGIRENVRPQSLTCILKRPKSIYYFDN